MDEELELAELNRMLGRSLEPFRESDVTLAKFQQWRLADERRRNGEESRMDLNARRRFRKEQHEKYVQYGRSHRNEIREQMRQASERVKNHVSHNMAKGGRTRHHLLLSTVFLHQ